MKLQTKLSLILVIVTTIIISLYSYLHYITVHSFNMKFLEFYSTKELFLILGSIIFLGILFYYFLGCVSNPIKKLTKNIDQITKGNLNINLEKSNIYEIQVLTNSLNRILASLKLAILRTGASKSELGLGEAIKAKEKAESSQKYAEDIVETIREPMIILNYELKVLSANPAFYKTFKVNPKETIGNLIYNLGNKQWDIPELRKLLENILPKEKVFNDYRVEHTFKKIGKKVMLLNARQIDHIQEILLAFEDITGGAREREREGE